MQHFDLDTSVAFKDKIATSNLLLLAPTDGFSVDVQDDSVDEFWHFLPLCAADGV